MSLTKDRINSIVNALLSLNGIGKYDDIYKVVMQDENFKYENFSTDTTFQATIRQLIQAHSSDSITYNKNNEDLFYSVEGLGKGVWGLRKYRELSNAEEVELEEVFYSEGREYWAKHRRIERNQKVITIAKKNFKNRYGHLFCQVCGFDFEKTYGRLGEDFIEAHHIIPISKKGESQTKTDDLMMVCSNCHRMIHRSKDAMNGNFSKLLIH